MNQINGLPAHILIVHFVVVGVPLAALLTVLSAVWPAARRRLGVITPIVAAGALISVPVATNAGEWLEQRVFLNDLIRRHTQLGGQLLWWVVGLLVAAVLAWGLPFLAGRLHRERELGSVWVRVGVAVLAVGFAAVSVVQVVRIGDAGSQAAWKGEVCAVPYENGQCPNNNFIQ